MAFFSFFKKKKNESVAEKNLDNEVKNEKDLENKESLADDTQDKMPVEKEHAEVINALENVGAEVAAAEFYDDTVKESDLKQHVMKEIKKETTRAENSFVISDELEANKTIIADQEEFKDQYKEKEPEASKQEAVVNTENEIEPQDKAIEDKTIADTSSSQEKEDTETKTEESEVKEETEANKSEKLSFFERLKRTRDNIAMGLSSFIKGRKIDEDLYEELETALLTADLGVETTEFVINKLRNESKLRELHDASLLKKNLKEILSDILKPCEQKLDVSGHKPYVILMVGVNGAGKTTTIGKLARKFQDNGLKVMLAAGDTFRAAAVEQLKEWGTRANVPVIAQATGSDSASVLFDAVNSAKARNMDVLICDTAGRLQNKDNLMEELKKIVRVMKKVDETVPHEILLVLDATTGQNAVSQATLFSKAVPVSGICLTKLDGTAKGGVIFTLADKFKLPIRYVGIGEKAADLREFKVDVFVDALVKDED